MIRKAGRQDLALMIEWAAREGWNPGLDDLAPFYAADPDGYWMADVDGVPAAAVSLVRHDPDYGFLGFYIVSPEQRGKGYGLTLWREIVANSDAATIGLDGVVAQQENYRKSGFAYAHANARYGGKLVFDLKSDPRLVPAHAAPQDALIAYDRRHNPGARPRFMMAWLTDCDTRKSFAFIEDGAVQGLATIRRCNTGAKIGPLFADTPEIADRLFRHLVAAIGGGDVYLDIPMPNADARALTQRYDMEAVFETARMYRGVYPELPLARIFGVTTFELG